jgi:hypothetical protein
MSSAQNSVHHKSPQFIQTPERSMVMQEKIIFNMDEDDNLNPLEELKKFDFNGAFTPGLGALPIQEEMLPYLQNVDISI